MPRLRLTLTALETGTDLTEADFRKQAANLTGLSDTLSDTPLPADSVTGQWGHLTSAVQAGRARAAALTAEADRLGAQADKLRKLEGEQRQTLDTVTAKFKVMDDLHTNSQGAVSYHEFLNARQELQQARAALVTTRGSLLETQKALEGIGKKQLEDRATTLETTHRQLAEAQSRLRAASQELVKAERRAERSRLSAPVTGHVSDLKVHTIGEMVQTGERLMTIVPDGAGMEIEALMQNKDRGDVWPGQSARIKVAAYPFTKYGVLPGEIMRISPDAVEVEGVGLMFPVQLRLLEPSMQVRGASVRLGAGMAVTVEAKAGSRTVLQYLITPLARIADEAFHEK